jgi:hypothetical protein
MSLLDSLLDEFDFLLEQSLSTFMYLSLKSHLFPHFILPSSMLLAP